MFHGWEGILNAETLSAIAAIVVIDLVLSGDNAVVIGMAAHRLPPEQRQRARFYGAAGAIGLRVLFTAMAAILLGIPLLQLIGGALLVWIAIKLLRPEGGGHGNIKAADTQFEAIRTIIIADVVMSLDNILAVGGAAHGSLYLLGFGLLLSMPIIMWGSGLVSAALDRFSWLAYVGSGVLAWTAGSMMMHDGYVKTWLGEVYRLDTIVPAVITVVVLGIGYFWRRGTGSDASPPVGAEPKTAGAMHR